MIKQHEIVSQLASIKTLLHIPHEQLAVEHGEYKAVQQAIESYTRQFANEGWTLLQFFSVFGSLLKRLQVAFPDAAVPKASCNYLTKDSCYLHFHSSRNKRSPLDFTFLHQAAQIFGRRINIVHIRCTTMGDDHDELLIRILD